MEDEVFEKIFKKIEDIYFALGDYEFEFSEAIRKQKLKEILEEIEKKAFDEGYDEGVEFWES